MTSYSLEGPHVTATRRFDRTLFVDADDTLWENNVFYLQCTGQVLDEMAAYGIDHDIVQAELDRQERDHIPTLGYGPRCYLTALEATCRSLLAERGITPPRQLMARIRSYARVVLDPPMLLLPKVRETLQALRPTSRLVLVTKGASDVQSAKLRRSGLEGLFDESHIVPEKHPGTYTSLVEQLELEPTTTWMIGNSPRSDINPACEAGLGAIYIPHHSTWSAEMVGIERPQSVVTLGKFDDLIAFFGLDEA